MKLKNKIFTIFTILLPLYSNANVLDNLKDTPLSVYDFGKNQILTITNVFNLFMIMEQPDKRVKLTVIEENNKLGINILEYKKASKVTSEKCNDIFNDTPEDLKFMNQFLSETGIKSETELSTLVIRFIWPNIKDEEVEKIQSELFIKHTIIAKENNNFTVSCSKLFSQIR